MAACLYDEVAGIGGMNHFMLPASQYGERMCGSYGVHAMEILINDLMNRGAARSRLKAKLFGGGTVVENLTKFENVGHRNIRFAREFLAKESIPLVAKKSAGNMPSTCDFIQRPLRPRSNNSVRRQHLKSLLPKANVPPRSNRILAR